MSPEAVVLVAFARTQRREQRVSAVASTLAAVALLFATFTTFAGLSSDELGVLRAGLVLGVASGAAGLMLVALAVRSAQRQRLRFHLGAAIMASPSFGEGELAHRLGWSTAKLRTVVAQAGREGWLTFMAREPVYGAAPGHPQSNAINRDQSGVTTKGHVGTSR